MNAHMNTILAAILVVIVVSILMNNSMRSYLFNTIMGRALLLFLIICITILNEGLGLIMTIIVIGLHTNQEGFDDATTSESDTSSSSHLSYSTSSSSPFPNLEPSSSSPFQQLEPSSSSSSHLSHSSAESFTNNNNNKYGKYNKIDKISAENRVRPRQSKGLPIPHVHRKREPESNSPNNESFLSYSPF